MSVQVINSATSRGEIQSTFKLKKIILITVLALIAGAIGYGYYLYHKPHDSINDQSTHFKLSAASLVEEYGKDEKQANDKYLGKVLEVKGTISEIIKDEKGKYNVTLQGADLSGVGCEFDPSVQKEVATLREGQDITVKGICTGVLLDVVLVDCVTVK